MGNNMHIGKSIFVGSLMRALPLSHDVGMLHR
jgi:hypothetical protein